MVGRRFLRCGNCKWMWGGGVTSSGSAFAVMTGCNGEMSTEPSDVEIYRGVLAPVCTAAGSDLGVGIAAAGGIHSRIVPAIGETGNIPLWIGTP